ncbi:MAG: rhomboid family intramembrane serine protease [Muribaculaceae bacterium]|nr:rhomboid family intramembrane serine protease [Muribaculaceae bacterium]
MLHRPSWNVLYAFIAACVLMYVMQIAASWAGAGNPAGVLVLSSDPADLATMPWTLLTYSLVHRDVLHLLLNMLWLYVFGRIMLGYASQFRLAWIMAGGALCGALCFLAVYALWPSLGRASLMGASAAILAIGTCTAVDMPELPLKLGFIGCVKLKWVVVALVGLFCIGLTGSAASTAAHAGGAVFGVVAAILHRKAASRHTSHPDSPGSLQLEYGALIAKVRNSGYESLSKRDKERLFHLSYKVKQ